MQFKQVLHIENTKGAFFSIMMMIDEAHSIARHFNSYFNKKPLSHTKIPVLVLFIYCGMACSFMHPVSVKNPAALRTPPSPKKTPYLCTCFIRT